MSLSPGTTLAQYEIIAPLGAGGMGEVWRARDTRLDREVAIKVLPEEFFEDKERETRFEREAKTLAAVNHPNIAAVFSFEEISGRFFLVQELLEGESLRATMSRGALPLKKALDVAIQVAEGLAAAHGKGIVHRDVKPENVFLAKDGHVKLLDFGLARHDVSRRDAADTRAPTLAAVSQKGVVLGTVAYMSPEQARGEAVDYRSDQFSLGTVLYEMLTGKRPFEGASPTETMAAIIREEPEPLTSLDPKLPAQVGWLVQRLLSKDPEERYASTKDLARELQSLRTHLSEAVSAPGIRPSEARPLRRRIPLWSLGAVTAVAVAIGLFVGTRFLRRGLSSAPFLSLTLSFPTDAAPVAGMANPLALSPDGRTLVYVGLRGDKQHLFVRPLDRDEIRPLAGTDDAVEPFFSPDGQWVGYFGEGKLKKVALAGGSPVTLCEAPDERGGSWGADGTIVFGPSPSAGLWRIPASGGEPKLLLAGDPGKGERPLSPQILPDGENVLFQRARAGEKSQAGVLSLRTGKERIVLEDVYSLLYLPTGHLLFARKGVLYAAPFSLQRLVTTGPPVPLIEDVFTERKWRGGANLAWSREGTLVYIPYRVPRRTLVWVDRKGAADPLPFPPGGYTAVSLSPDGARMAAISVGRAEEQSLLFGDFSRRTLTRSPVEGLFWRLAWTPDGKRVAFGAMSEEERKGYRLLWQGADGDAPAEYLGTGTPLQTEGPASFSPDGSVLLVQAYNLARPDAVQETLVLPLAGERKPRPVIRTKSSVYGARFSPDGSWVAYASDEPGRYEIFVQPYPGPGPRWQISSDGGEQPRWAQSGRELFFRSGDKIMAVDVETKPTFRAKPPRPLFEGSHFISGDDTYEVAPDGRFLMIKPDPDESGPAHVKVVTNWFEEVQRRVPGAK